MILSSSSHSLGILIGMPAHVLSISWEGIGNFSDIIRFPSGADCVPLLTQAVVSVWVLSCEETSSSYFSPRRNQKNSESPGWPETKFGSYKARKGMMLQIILRNGLRKTSSSLDCDPTSSLLLTLLTPGFGYCL